VIGDQQRLVQVVCNLLTNAAKYTPPGGRIAVACECSDDRIVFRVSDNGIGIEPELLPAVFDLFTQAARAPDRALGGLGIGLAVVRTIVQAHGGRISAQSAGLGEGSTFTVELPRSHQVPAAAPPAPREPAAGNSRKVLIVDDNADAADMLGVALRLLGHDVAVANGGEEALSIAAASTGWDAFILDIGMPRISGLELARELRKCVAARPARFIALTGYGQAHDLARTREAGFDHHMVKPADIDELQRLLAQPRSTSPTLSR
jgi:CheY-like chemotaxis protein